ncbi:MAG: beta strand repeat-containing protein, partial [Burkholderiales bacterium]
AAVISGLTNLTAGDDITLTQVANNFVGAVTGTGNDIRIIDGVSGIVLGNIASSGTDAGLTVISTSGAISQAASTTISSIGITSLNAQRQVGATGSPGPAQTSAALSISGGQLTSQALPGDLVRFYSGPNGTGSLLGSSVISAVVDATTVTLLDNPGISSGIGSVVFVPLNRVQASGTVSTTQSSTILTIGGGAINSEAQVGATVQFYSSAGGTGTLLGTSVIDAITSATAATLSADPALSGIASITFVNPEVIRYGITVDNTGNNFVGAVNLNGNAVTIADSVGGLALGIATSARNLSASSTGGALHLGTTTVGGALTARATGGNLDLGTTQARSADAQTITSGNIVQTGNLSIANALSLVSAGDITLPAAVGQTAVKNSLSGVISATGTNVRIATGDSASGNDPSVMRLGNITAGGTLAIVNDNGAVTQESGTALAITGTSDFNSAILNGRANITLSSPTNNFIGSVSGSAHNIVLYDGVGALTTGQVNATGDFTATSAAGALSLGSSSIGGVLTANALTNLDLGTASVGSLVARSDTGNITQAGALNTVGTAVATASNGNISLTNIANVLGGAVSL